MKKISIIIIISLFYAIQIYSQTYSDISLMLNNFQSIKPFNVKNASFNKFLDKKEIDSDVIGEFQEVNLNINNSGEIFQIGDSLKGWRIKLKYPEAKKISFSCSEFEVGANTVAYIFNNNYYDSKSLSIYYDNVHQKRIFNSGYLKGDEIAIEIISPIETFDSNKITINQIHAIYESNQVDSRLKSADPCHIDVLASGYEDYCNVRRATVKIYINWTEGGVNLKTWCSGAIITNAKHDGRPYILTAHHCLDRDDPKDRSISEAEKGYVNDYEIVFNYQSSNPSETDVMTGCSYVSAKWGKGNNRKVDYALIQLNNRPLKDYNVYYAGWDSDDIKWNEGVVIHHPRGDLKKISEWESHNELFWSSWTGKVKLTAGGLEGGSSGAPYFKTDKRICGQHSSSKSGASPCSQNDWRRFGRFSKTYYDYIGTTLNPNGDFSGSYQHYYYASDGYDLCRPGFNFTNADDLHTSSFNEMTEPWKIGQRMYDGIYWASGQITAENNVTIKSGTHVEFHGSSIILKHGFKTEPGATFRAVAEPCPSGCNQGNKKSVQTSKSDQSGVYLNSELKRDSSNTDNYILKDTVHFYSSIIIYPNPSQTGIVYISNVNKPKELWIYNSSGMLVKHKEVFNSNSIIQVDLSMESTGLYLIIIKTDQDIFRNKISLIK